MADLDLLIHIGYHRTGTTWLQKHVFKDRTLGFVSLDRRDARQHLVLPHALDFNPQRCKAHFDPLLERIIEDGLLPVLSMERLCGSPHSGGYDSKEIAERLVQVFPEAKIFVVIREQEDMILSTYAQYVRAGGALSLNAYLQPPARGIAKIPSFDFAHFQYHRLLQYYIDLFSKPNVLGIPYEVFKSTPLDYMRIVVDFARRQVKDAYFEGLPFAVRENEALSAVSLAFKRRINLFIAERNSLYPGVLVSIPRSTRIIENGLRALDSILPEGLQAMTQKRLKTAISKLVGERYKRSNQLSAQLLGLNLAQYGYAVT